MAHPTRIAVLGGTGYAGEHVVREAASRGLPITSVSRSAPPSPIAGVRVVQADVAEPGALTPIVAEADVVIGALSPRGTSADRFLPAYRRLVGLATGTGARLVVIGGYGSLRTAPGGPRISEGDIPERFKFEATQLLGVLTALQASDPALDWLFVSPPADFGRWTDLQPNGTYRVGGDVAFPADGERRSAIAGADFARAVVDLALADRHREQVSVAW